MLRRMNTDDALDVSGLRADLRLMHTQAALNAAEQALRAAETASHETLRVVIHSGSGYERVLTRMGEVMLQANLWFWCLRGRRSSAVAIAAEMPHMRPYLEQRTAWALQELTEELGRTRSVAERDIIDECRRSLEQDRAALESFGR